MNAVGERLDSYEDEFLRQAERQAGRIASGFSGRVKRRLAVGAELYGDTNYLRLGILKMLTEVRFEAEDLGGYSTLISQAMLKEHDEGMDDDTIYQIQRMLASIATYGALVDAVVDQIDELYKNAKGI